MWSLSKKVMGEFYYVMCIFSKYSKFSTVSVRDLSSHKKQTNLISFPLGLLELALV